MRQFKRFIGASYINVLYKQTEDVNVPLFSLRGFPMTGHFFNVLKGPYEAN